MVESDGDVVEIVESDVDGDLVGAKTDLAKPRDTELILGAVLKQDLCHKCSALKGFGSDLNLKLFRVRAQTKPNPILKSLWCC